MTGGVVVVTGAEEPSSGHGVELGGTTGVPEVTGGTGIVTGAEDSGAITGVEEAGIM